MKTIINYLLFTLVFSCDAQNKNEPEKSLFKQEHQVHYNSNQIKQSKWVQYKRISGTNHNDTTPCTDCIIILNGSKFSYIISNKIIYSDSIYLNKQYKAKRYDFKERNGDIMILLDNELILKRNYPEGEHEYFKELK